MNILELKEKNYVFDSIYRVNEEDVKKANMLRDAIEFGRCGARPQPGDLVVYTNIRGEYYASAHIESVTDKEAYICEHPYIPFVEMYDGDTGFNTSGGAWSSIPRNMKFLTKVTKNFKTWGHCGAGAHGAITFTAEVNAWEYIEGTHQYTEKTHDRFFLYKVEDGRYPYILMKQGYNHKAFAGESEYREWLEKFKGVELDSEGLDAKIVWTPKQFERYIPIEDYLSLNDTVIDSQLCNGSIQQCKRRYSDKGIETFFPYQNDKIVV